jgi:hypothetical protein
MSDLADLIQQVQRLVAWERVMGNVFPPIGVLQSVLEHLQGYHFVCSLFKLMRKYDKFHDLIWDDDLNFEVICSDDFFWGSADGERVTSESLSQLEQAFKDCEKAVPDFGPLYGNMLYAARRRKMRPQGAAYPEYKALWPLFDACGPERKIELGNPYKPGEYQEKQVMKPLTEDQRKQAYHNPENHEVG